MENVFIESLTHITAGSASLVDVISACERLQASQRSDLAEQIYRTWIQFNLEHPLVYVAYFNCAKVITDIARHPETVMLLEASLAANPQFDLAAIELGTLKDALGRPDEAIASWTSVVERLSVVSQQTIHAKVEALRQISRVHLEQGETIAGDAALRQSLAIQPNQPDVLVTYIANRMASVQSPVLEPWGGVTRTALIEGMSPLSALAYADDPILQYAVAGRYVRETILKPLIGTEVRRHGPIEGVGQRPLRVGYLSSDLRDHAIGYLMTEFFECQDRSVVETLVFNCGPPSTSPQTQRIQGAVDGWFDVNGLSDAAAADLIAASSIDILIDINGHTKFDRMKMLALRPAPIIVNWLGFPGTVSTPFHDYIVADEWIIPEHLESFYSETVLRLPCYQPNDRKRAISPTPLTRAMVGLPNDSFVYACFNGHHKFTKFQLRRWAAILNQAPQSVLWLLEGTVVSRANILKVLGADGIGPERVIFAPSLGSPLHLARIGLADLFLDTSPYGAHTSASDALWVGLPVLTLSGTCFASRVCGSLVRSAGLPEMVCNDKQTYFDLATQLYADRERLAAMRAKLTAEHATCDLFNLEKLIQSLYSLFHAMCRDYNSGSISKPIMKDMDLYCRISGLMDHENTDFSENTQYRAQYMSKISAMMGLTNGHLDAAPFFISCEK